VVPPVEMLLNQLVLCKEVILVLEEDAVADTALQGVEIDATEALEAAEDKITLFQHIDML
jgi:hypothetical protein